MACSLDNTFLQSIPKRPDTVAVIDREFSSHEWNQYNFGPSAVFEYILSYDDSRPDLFVIASISEVSMIETTKIIISMLHVLEKKYRRIFIIKFCHMNNKIQEAQKNVCMKRDEIKFEEEHKKIIIKKETASTPEQYVYVSNNIKYYKPEMEFYNVLATMVNYIITYELKLTNVELLGKSAGGCIAINVANMSNYKALYLASPASPSYLSDLKKKTMKVHIGWPCNDLKYNHMKYKYDSMMEAYNTYSSRIYSIWDKSDGHELHPDMLYDIISL